MTPIALGPRALPYYPTSQTTLGLHFILCSNLLKREIGCHWVGNHSYRRRDKATNADKADFML